MLKHIFKIWVSKLQLTKSYLSSYSQLWTSGLKEQIAEKQTQYTVFSFQSPFHSFITSNSQNKAMTVFTCETCYCCFLTHHQYNLPNLQSSSDALTGMSNTSLEHFGLKGLKSLFDRCFNSLLNLLNCMFFRTSSGNRTC